MVFHRFRLEVRIPRIEVRGIPCFAKEAKQGAPGLRMLRLSIQEVQRMRNQIEHSFQ
jgi:hypothetical protein